MAASTVCLYQHSLGALTSDFFVNLLDMSTEWKPAGDIYEGYDRKTGERKWTGTRVRSGVPARTRSCVRWPRCSAVPTVRSSFISEFVAAWVKVMNLDRFDLAAA
ncbi:hypothetical protein ACU4HD_46620 [Cupriavidus basilensis]